MHLVRPNATPEQALSTIVQAAAECPACGSMAPTAEHAERQSCHVCGTIWVPQRRNFAYDDAYPAARGHHEAMVARCKQMTLQSWLHRTDMSLHGQRVLEVGFGGGATLQWAQAQGALAFGQEPVAANRAAAIAAGIPSDRVKQELADFKGHQFDLLLYLDSFEHVLDPVTHLAALNTLARPGTRALLVLPVADSLSRRLLGRLWPHDVADHWVFYSTSGLTQLWQRFGWRHSSSFYPWKYLSLQTITRHAQMKTGVTLPIGKLARRGVWLNFGERGFIFEKLPA